MRDSDVVTEAATGQGNDVVVMPNESYAAPGDIQISSGDASNDRIDLLVLQELDDEWY